MKSWIKNGYPLVLEVLIIIICLAIIVQSETFQEKICPQKYWSTKVDELEGDVKLDQWKVRSIELSLEKEKATGHYMIQAAIDHAKSFGKDVEKVAQTAVNDYEEKLSCLEKDLEASKEALNAHQLQLLNAKLKLENEQRLVKN
ncbi:MAG: hypothetical protein COT84_07025 [Chlamydiae bacterium CG10_big_fil_rev_8_21_14_0_10_35_9]|nr:MAG: hypothetical protein COT84_07025 [Chlamydiae bacterium CG10_big_fil_rev_8_21_14_0_10_35_9]